jgi:uncharacterized protein YifN (PemK superfamily)
LPNALRVFKALKAAAFADQQALAIGTLIASAQVPPAQYDETATVDLLCDEGFDEPLAEDIARSLAFCFPSERFKATYKRTQRKVALVRSGMPAATADALLDAIDPCIKSGRDHEVRAPILHAPGAGRVVMCDFRFLKKPEMQKERRAIVVAKGPGRCIVVPVSKNPSNAGHPLHHQFTPGAYPFFHATDPVWAVCDHLYTVSLDRLWQVNVHRRPTIPSLTPADLASVRKLLATGLGV